MAEDRRTLLKVLTGLLGGGAAAAVGVPSIGAALAPLRKITVTGAGEFVGVGTLEAIPADGTPLKVPVVLEAPTDAWNVLPPTEVGAVYLARGPEGVVAHSTICPHLGCGVDYLAARKRFACPCHDSGFALSGEVVSGPSPRPMDRLETRISGGRVEVRFQKFVIGTAKKVPA